MDPANAHTRNHLRKRLALIAMEEVDELLRGIKENFPQLRDLTVALEDSPGTGLLKAGAREGQESRYDQDKQELVLFLFNIYKANKQAPDFRKRIRDLVLTIAGGLVGEYLCEDDCG